jgi:diguanylate cyclase (GGDEF)-like protein
MININNIPITYLCISLILSGFTIFSLIKSVYMYSQSRRKEVLPQILLILGAVLYITSDTTAMIYYILTSDQNTARFFIIIRELASLLFLIAIPYLANQALILTQSLKKLNNIIFRFAIISSAAILMTTVLKPELLTAKFIVEAPVNYRQIVVIQNVEFLYLLKIILITAYLLYAVFIFLYSNTYNKVFYPVNKIISGLFILIYFTLSGIYSIYFFSGNTGYVNYYYPHISTGIALFILFNSFGLIDIIVDYASKLLKSKNDLERILHYDSELGIPNRSGFLNDLEIKMNEQKKNGGSLSLIFLDIDDFQSINESFGEEVGDGILKLLTIRLLELFSTMGNLYRIGGDDFVFMLKGISSEEESVSFAGKVITSLRNPFPISGSTYMITASLGIIQIPKDGDDINSILNNAYSVIRDAKQTKNTYRVFTNDIVDYSSKKVSIVNLLRTSISTDQFTMFYQPIVDKDENIVYAESLLRCTNPDPSIGGPGIFIPLMEKAGIMKDIDDMVIRKVFHDIEMHIKKRFKISINLSSTQLTNPAYSDFLSEFAIQQRIEPEQIILEVVENTLIENFTRGRESLLRLKNHGFKIAIDDFGKGFSSLSYLAELPIDILKIDMEFVQSIPGDRKKEAIVYHIMQLAHSLDLKIVAEGFETKEQFDFFRELGCDNFQGYYFSRPAPLDQLLQKYHMK